MVEVNSSWRIKSGSRKGKVLELKAGQLVPLNLSKSRIKLCAYKRCTNRRSEIDCRGCDAHWWI